jgi:hypothetical protein
MYIFFTQSAQAFAYSFRYMKCGSSATHYGIKKEFQHMSAFKANQHELQQNNESLIVDAQRKGDVPGGGVFSGLAGV